MKQKIIILGAGLLQVPAIVKAREMGLHVIAMDIDPNAIGFEYADEYFVISTIDIEKVLEVSKQIKPQGIMTVASDKPMLTVAKVGETLGLNTISKETSIKVTNKASMRECLFNRNIPIPKFKVVSTLEEYLGYIEEIKEKFIVKPVDSSGSRGIFLVEDRKEAMNAYNHSLKYSSTGEILIEEYLEGPEVSVESITIHGKTHIVAITDKETTGVPHFVEVGHSIPSRLSDEVKDEIKKITCNSIRALGIEVGPSHTEIKITEEGPKIIEVGARLGGDNITTHLVPLATGIDIVKKSIEIAIGKTPELNELKNRASAIKYFTGIEGTLKDINGYEEAIKIPGVKEVVFTKSIGERVNSLTSSIDRLGFVISQAETCDECIELCKNAIETIDISIK